jgi:Fe-S oxidoreductase
VLLIDEFVAQEMMTGNYQLRATNGSIAIHGHCHQKALYGTDSLKSIYRNAQLNFQEIPSGCCGMAGSFGYEKEHYQISKKIGEDVLFPAVEKLKDTHTIVANGFSCRHQIEHFTGTKAKHWVQTVSIKD